MERLKSLNPLYAVCFSGHRPERLPGRGAPSASETAILKSALQDHIRITIELGKHVFINGLMAGWDIMAAEQVMLMKKSNPHIILVTVAPYSSQFFSREKCWTDDWKKRAKEVCRQSEICVSLSVNYRSGIYYKRNRVMVDHSSELICFCDGGNGGTKFTMQYAAKKGRAVINLFSHSNSCIKNPEE